MDAARARVAAALAEVELRPPTLPVYCGLTGRPYEGVEQMRELLPKQLVEPVLWEECVRHVLTTHTPAACFEVGPGKLLKAMMRRIDVGAWNTMKCIEA